MPSVPQHVSRTFAEPVAGADVGERRSRIGMPGEILQVDDVAAAFPGGGQGGDAERMHGDVGIEAEGFDVAADQLFHRPGGHRLGRGIHPGPCLAASGRRGNNGPAGSSLTPGTASHCGQSLDGFQVQRRGAFLAALAGDVQDAVLAAVLVIADAEPDQLADAAAGIGQHGQHGPVAAIDRRLLLRLFLGGIEQAAAIVRRQADGLAVA